MPQLDEEAIEEIREDYAKTGAIEKTAQNTGRAKDTVQKYTADMREDGSDDSTEDQEDEDDEWTGTPPSETPFSSSRRMPLGEGNERVDYASMGPGEFIDYFFEELDMGVKSDFAQMLSRMAELRGEIPDGDQLSLLIQQHGSGIGNANDANMIAEIYDDMADKYLSEKGMSGGAQAAFGNRGQWQQPGDQQGRGAADGGMMGQPPGQGSWSSVPDGSQQQQPVMGGQGNRPPNSQFGPQQGQQGQQPQMFQMFQSMMEQMQQQQERMMQKFEEMNREQQQSQSDDGDDMISQMEKVLRMREMLDQMDQSGQDSNEMEQMVHQFQQQVQALRQQIQEDDSGPTTDAGDPRMNALVRLASDKDMDMDRLEMLAGTLGMDSDPEIKKAQIEKEIQENKSERRQEMLEEGISALGEVANDLVESGLDTVVGPGNVDEPTQNQQPTQSGQQDTHQQQTAQGGESHAGEKPKDNQATGSPMREKYANAAAEEEPEQVEEEVHERREAEAEPEEHVQQPAEQAETDLYDLGYGIIEQKGLKTTDYGKFVSEMTDHGATREDASEVWGYLRDEGVIEKGSRTAESDTAAAVEGGDSS